MENFRFRGLILKKYFLTFDIIFLKKVKFLNIIKLTKK